MARKILALEYDSEGVRAALAEQSWSLFELKDVFEEKRSQDEPDLIGALNRIVGKIGHPNVVISALPGELAAKRLLELPFHDRRRLEQAVPFALEEHLPFAVDDAIVAYAVVGRQAENSIIFAAMALKADLHKHLELLAQVGLNPKIVTLSAMGLPALLARTRNGSPSHRLVLDIEQTRTSLVLIDCNGTLRVMRTVRAPLNLRNSHPRVRSQAEPIFAAVRQTLRAQGPKLEGIDVILTGSLGIASEIRDALVSALSGDPPVSVHGADELDCSAVAGLTPPALRFACCVGLLLSEMRGTRTHLIDFRHGEFVYRSNAGNLRPQRSAAALALAVVAVALLHFLLGVSNNLHRLHLLDDAIVRAAVPALGPNPPPKIKAALANGIAGMNKRLRMVGGDEAAGMPLNQLLALSRAVPSNLSVDLDEISIDDSGLKITGTADSFATVDDLKKVLGASDSFDRIKVDDAKGSADRHKVDFHLTAMPKVSPGS